MKRVVLFTLHYWFSRRRAGFHHIAQAYARAGWDVTFFTVYISPLMRLRGHDPRLQYPVVRQANRPVRDPESGVVSYVWYTPFHPFNLRLRWLNYLSTPLFGAYGRLPLGPARPLIQGADLLVLESHAGLLLLDRLRRLAPHARLVYRCSDDLDILGVHPVIRQAEQDAAAKFDLISVPCRPLLQRFTNLPDACCQEHGVERLAFDSATVSPYDNVGPHAVWVGTSYFDTDYLKRACTLCPTWQFHIIGPITSLPAAPNIAAYGEMPYRRTIPFLRHAHAGLQTIRRFPGADILTRSLKVQQYIYCRLPIVTPAFLPLSKEYSCPYRPGDDESIREAMDCARRFDRQGIPVNDIPSWDTVAASLAGDLW
jgi:2-beta-glucuronyltransferase